jgi:hypothetical protein
MPQQVTPLSSYSIEGRGSPPTATLTLTLADGVRDNAVPRRRPRACESTVPGSSPTVEAEAIEEARSNEKTPSIAKQLRNMVGTRRLELLTSTVSR